MILGANSHGSERDAGGGRATLDDLFRRAGVRGAAALALVDPPNREEFTAGAPRQLTFAQADRAISALAAKFCRLGLQTDAVVAVQLPNTVDNIITLLAILRAGMIAVPLPLLWRRIDITAALDKVGAKAIVTSSRIGAVAHADIAMQVAADLFPIRLICAFGDGLPDGVVSLDDIFDAEHTAVVPRSSRIGDPADHIAAVTFDLTTDGLVAVARSHAQLAAAGNAVLAECGGAQNAQILSAIPPGSFAGMAVTLLPWLSGGGTLSLHHGFDADTFAAQVRRQNDLQSAGRDGRAVVVPGAALAPLVEAGHIGGKSHTVVALWRAPEQLTMGATANPPLPAGDAVVDVASFGEIGVIASRRRPDGRPAAISCDSGAVARTRNGTLALRGPMVPIEAFPPGAEHGPGPCLTADESGFVDTGFTSRTDPAAQTLVVTGPPGGLATVGGYRFRPRELEALVAGADPAATVVAIPGAILAQRLAGSAIDNASVHAQLLESGANPLIAGAFRPRTGANAA